MFSFDDVIMSPNNIDGWTNNFSRPGKFSDTKQINSIRAHLVDCITFLMLIGEREEHGDMIDSCVSYGQN